MPKAETGFMGISLKKDLAEAVQEFIAKNPQTGYKSISDFVHDAVRHRIEELMKLYASSTQENRE